MPAVTHMKYLDALNKLIIAHHNKLVDRIVGDLADGALIPTTRKGITKHQAKMAYSDMLEDEFRLMDPRNARYGNPSFESLSREAASQSYENQRVTLNDVDTLMRMLAISPLQVPGALSPETVESGSDDDDN